MKVHIFRGPGRVFGFSQEEAGTNLPTRYAPWTHFKSVEMTKGEQMPGVNADECIRDIEKHGYHLTDAHVRITDSDRA